MLTTKGYGHLPIPCQTCFFRDQSSEVRDPCFPCESGWSFLFGEQRKFWLWTDGKLTEEEYEKWDEEQERRINKLIAEDPEIARLGQKIAESISNN